LAGCEVGRHDEVVISSIEIRVCFNTRPAMPDSEMYIGGRSTFDFLVISVKTDVGIEGSP
jgi:hypothetical protein